MPSRDCHLADIIWRCVQQSGSVNGVDLFRAVDGSLPHYYRPTKNKTREKDIRNRIACMVKNGRLKLSNDGFYTCKKAPVSCAFSVFGKLREIIMHTPGATLQQIAEQSNLSRPDASNRLHTLKVRGFIVQEGTGFKITAKGQNLTVTRNERVPCGFLSNHI